MNRKPVSAARLPKEWREVVHRPKTIIGWPDWSDVEALPTGKNISTRRNDIRTVSAEITDALFQLSDQNGTGLQGVRLRLKAWAYKRHSDVTATLEVLGGRSFVTISGIDAWPSDPHRNSFKVLKVPKLKGFPAELAECHVHRFDDNAQYGVVAFGAGPEGNLPVAAALPNALQSFRDFLRSVGTEFNVGGLDNFPSPPSWQGLV